jgi:hypothetical protein
VLGAHAAEDVAAISQLRDGLEGIVSKRLFVTRAARRSQYDGRRGGALAARSSLKR